MGQDGDGSSGESTRDGRPADGDGWVHHPDGSTNRPPSPRGGVIGVLDDLFARQTPIDRRLSLMLLGGVLTVPLLTALVDYAVPVGLGSAFVIALVVHAVVLVVPFTQAVRQDARLRRDGRRTTVNPVVQWLALLPIILLVTEFRRWLERTGMGEGASLVIALALAAVAGLTIPPHLARRLPRYSRIAANDGAIRE